MAHRKGLRQADSEIFQLVKKETQRQEEGLEMIP